MEGFELEEVKRVVTTQELDDAVKTLSALRKEHDELKSKASEKWEQCEEAEAKLLELLEASGKKSYDVDGVARVTLVSKTSITVPKDLEQKKKLFEWIKNRFGADGLLAYQTVNFQSLNSLYNKTIEEVSERGTDIDVSAFGLPSVHKTLQVRRK